MGKRNYQRSVMSTQVCNANDEAADVKPKIEPADGEPLAASGSARAAPPDEYDDDESRIPTSQLPNDKVQQDSDVPDENKQKRTSRKTKKKSTKQRRKPKTESKSKDEQKVVVNTPKSKRVARRCVRVVYQYSYPYSPAVEKYSTMDVITN